MIITTTTSSVKENAQRRRRIGSAPEWRGQIAGGDEWGADGERMISTP
jgi:hypothetical protein